MQVVARALRPRQRPIILIPPFILAHHKNLHRFLVLHPVRLALEKPVVPMQRHFVLIDRQLLAEIHRADPSVVVTPAWPPTYTTSRCPRFAASVPASVFNLT